MLKPFFFLFSIFPMYMHVAAKNNFKKRKINLMGAKRQQY